MKDFIPGPREAPDAPRTPPKPDVVARALRTRKRSRERTQPTYCPPEKAK